jgi:hypothetical protein
VKLVAAVVLFAACYRDAEPAQPQPAPPASKPAPAPTAYEQLESKLGPAIADLPKVEAAVQTADCPKIAAALRTFGAAHAADIDDIGALRDKLTPEDRQELDETHAADATRIRTLVESTLSTCKGDDEVRKALDVAGFRRKDKAP